MDSEHIIAEVVRWREKFTLEQLMDMFVEGLGGKEAVVAELGEDEDDEPDEEQARDLDAMRDADVERLEKIQGMAESFCTWLHAKGAQQMEQDTEEAVDKVQQLSASFNKAARAVRLSMVLKHEVAGLRPLPNVRAAPAEPANGNSPGARPGGAHGQSGERREDRETERAERREMENRVHAHLMTLSDALDKDLVNAPPEIQALAKRESLVVKLTTIAASIPHPHLDRKVADMELGKLWDNIAPRYAEKPEALGPPDPEILKHRSWNNNALTRAQAAKAARRK